MPIEVIKQRSQANRESSLFNLKQTYRENGLRGQKLEDALLKWLIFINFVLISIGFYRGYFTTVFREIPFSFIQYPLWEFLKRKTCEFKGCKSTNFIDSLICGAIAGGVAAFLTTPLDVAKTRIILARKTEEASKGNFIYVLKEIYSERGMRGSVQF